MNSQERRYKDISTWALLIRLEPALGFISLKERLVMVLLQNSMHLVISRMLRFHNQTSMLTLSQFLLGIRCFLSHFDDVAFFLNSIPVSTMLRMPNIRHFCLSADVQGNGGVGLSQ